MKTISTSESAPLTFSEESGLTPKKINAASSKIGWIHAMLPSTGGSFDLTIKDGLGRTKFHHVGLSSETDRFGQLVNLPTLLGEQLEITVENLKGTKKVDLFLN